MSKALLQSTYGIPPPRSPVPGSLAPLGTLLGKAEMRRLPCWKPRFLLVPLGNSLSLRPAVSSVGHGRVPPFHLVKEAARNTGSGFIWGISQNLFNSAEETFNSAGTHMTGPLAIAYSCKKHLASSLPALTGQTPASLPASLTPPSHARVPLFFLFFLYFPK